MAAADNRTLAGHSLGCLFVGLALCMDRPGGRYFSNFISQDGSFGLPWVDQATVGAMELGMFDSSNGELPVTLIMSGAANYRLMSDLYDKIVSRGYRDLHAVK